METTSISGKRVENLKRKVKSIGGLVVDSAMKQIGSETTLTLALGVGLIQGLKYNGNLKRGIKAGLATIGVVAGVNVVSNVAKNWEQIKNL